MRLSHLPISSCSAILSDITTAANRSKALAHVGIAFAICFCIGPPIGAYFASRPLPQSFNSWGVEFNIYAVPAFITVVLLVAETVFLIVALPETRGTKPSDHAADQKAAVNGQTKGSKVNGAGTNGNGAAATALPKTTIAQRISTLKTLRQLHFMFLSLFSGVEFTLTFLTFDRESPVPQADPAPNRQSNHGLISPPIQFSTGTTRRMANSLAPSESLAPSCKEDMSGGRQPKSVKARWLAKE